jgi:hypothetical protein
MEIYNTTWWGNAIDTAITAGTEPDFFGSQMKMLTGQPELVTNGDFATDSNWTKQGNVSISSGSANFIDNGSNLYAFIRQNISQIDGKNYLLKFEIKNYLSGALQVILEGSGIAATYNSNGVYSIFIESSVSGGYLEFSRNFGGGTFSFSIDNVSIKLARAEEVEAVKCLADWIHTTALQDLNN